jgi:ribose/xylose/arabinose/galactoside ABC-type transport system permease subunit
VNFPFFVVLVAAICGLLFESALRSIAPEAGPAIALALMAAATIAGARLLSRRRAAAKAATAEQGAGQSLNPA